MGPRHRKARHFLSIGLFDGIDTFAELEKRISEHKGTNLDKGHALEVFVEGYLNTHPTHKCVEVWPDGAIPAEVLGELVLSAKDHGVDGVYLNTDNKYHGYQVKFRSDRKPLSWGKDSIGNFAGQSDRCAHRFVFANSDRIDDVSEDRINFSTVHGFDFDTLMTPAGFDLIRAWLSDAAPIPVERFEPREDQCEAINSITHAFVIHDRASAVMACGTGKTLVALWTAERLTESGAKSFIVLVPSLALMKQTIHEWLEQTSIKNFDYICVCSDDSVKDPNDDAIVLNISDLDFPVTTDSAQIADFLSRDHTGVCCVFTTYQSVREVAKGMPDGISFDFGVFDEAHKTAGLNRGLFPFALHDKNIRIKKRLFMTATPRKYDLSKRNKEGDAELICSMDNEKLYGQVCYRLSFSEAVRRKIICGYKIIVSIITSADLTPEQLPKSDTEVKGELIRAQQVAHQVVIAKSIEKYGVSKIISFHGSIEAAKSFTCSGAEGIGSHLPGFSTLHVNGGMNAGIRARALNVLREPERRGIISNARCLTEGVNVPAMDMVVFTAPKESKIDIVQAAGRTMRLSPETGKKLGYVLIPLYIDQAAGEIMDDATNRAIARTKFKDVWNVLNAMQEHDTELFEIIREIQVDKGRGKGFNDTQLRNKIGIESFSNFINLEDMQRSLMVECVEALGSSWDLNFGKLINYSDRFGHCNVLQKWDEDPSLGRWCNTQRQLRRKGCLSASRIFKLEMIGFSWDPLTDAWEASFIDMSRFANRFGHCNVPKEWKEVPPLSRWGTTQRQDKNPLCQDSCRLGGAA